MATAGSPNGRRLCWVIAGLGIIVAVIALWSMQDGDSEGTEGRGPAERPGAMDQTAPVPESSVPPPPSVRAPAVYIADTGRLSITREALREGHVLALGFEMSDAARGTAPRPAKIVDVGGRVLELEAVPVDGPGTGLRLEIDPEWLEPSRYMIQVEVAEGGPLPVRRYVLEVLASEGSADAE